LFANNRGTTRGRLRKGLGHKGGRVRGEKCSRGKNDVPQGLLVTRKKKNRELGECEKVTPTAGLSAPVYEKTLRKRRKTLLEYFRGLYLSKKKKTSPYERGGGTELFRNIMGRGV